jgi:hypothetical protein
MGGGFAGAIAQHLAVSSQQAFPGRIEPLLEPGAVFERQAGEKPRNVDRESGLGIAGSGPNERRDVAGHGWVELDGRPVDSKLSIERRSEEAQRLAEGRARLLLGRLAPEERRQLLAGMWARFEGQERQ